MDIALLDRKVKAAKQFQKEFSQHIVQLERLLARLKKRE
jgi:hypothetical protein